MKKEWSGSDESEQEEEVQKDEDEEENEEENEKKNQQEEEKEEKEEIPYEPEEPEEVLEFIFSIITLFIERVFPEKPVVLTLEKAGKCLRTVGKIWNLSEYPPVNYFEGLNCGDCGDEKLMDMEGYVDDYQYLHIEAVDMALTDVRILPKHFVWLLSADFSGNRLDNESACPITKLPNLVALRLNRNRFEDPYMPVMRHLQYLTLNNNNIKSLHRVYHPNLETLGLNFNLIRTIDGEDCWKLPKLRQLELRGNQLTTTSGIEYATLVNLYLAQNQITELKGLEILVNLERLHLRKNPLQELTGFSKANAKLKYLNIRECLIPSLEEIQQLSVLSGLKELIVKGNTFNREPEVETRDEEEDLEDEEIEEEKVAEEEDEELRVQILAYIPTLTRIDKKVVTKEERQQMRELLNEEE